MSNERVFEASAESKGTAKQLRLFAILAWVIGIGLEIFAILKLIHNETLTWLIVAIIVILVLSITGSLLWKKANRLDPASEANKTKFFIQNQLGAILAGLCFLPLLLFILTNKNINGKTKGIAGAIAGVALLAGVFTGIDFNPPSIEKYTAQLNAQDSTLRQLTGKSDNIVYWAPNSEKYHLYQECQYIKGHAGVSQGTLEEAFKARKIGDNQLCSACEKKASNEKTISSGGNIIDEIKAAADSTK